MVQEPTHFDWVSAGCIAAMAGKDAGDCRDLLVARGNDVLVIVGPLNEHMIADDQLPEYRKMRVQIVAELRARKIAVIAPEVLPSELYADGSHPLTAGYAMLAGQIFGGGGI